MLKLIVFLDEQFRDWDFPDSRSDNTWDGAGVRWWCAVLLFLLFSAAGGYVFAHLLRIH